MLTLLMNDKIDVMPMPELRKWERERGRERERENESESTGKKTMG